MCSYTAQPQRPCGTHNNSPRTVLLPYDLRELLLTGQGPIYPFDHGKHAVACVKQARVGEIFNDNFKHWPSHNRRRGENKRSLESRPSLKIAHLSTPQGPLAATSKSLRYSILKRLSSTVVRVGKPWNHCNLIIVPATTLR